MTQKIDVFNHIFPKPFFERLQTVTVNKGAIKRWLNIPFLHDVEVRFRMLEEFGDVVARGGSGVVIASQSGHRLPPLTVEQNGALATTPVEELLGLPFLQPEQVTDSLHAYQLSKRGNSLRVMAEAVRWGRRGARLNTISPGIIMTPLARDELRGPRGAGYRRMIELSAAGRAGTPDEVGTVGALLMGPDGGFITGSDFLMDGGVTASYWYGELAPSERS